MSYTNRIAVVTGASRGAGAGIARHQVATGTRCTSPAAPKSIGKSALAGSIHETADQVDALGGQGIPIRVDHADDEQVQDFFERVARAITGRSTRGSTTPRSSATEMMGRTKFWKSPSTRNSFDTLTVGLRSSYVATVFAAPLMLPQHKGLVVFTSSSGAVHYAFGPAYGVPKAGTDKMAADMALDFKDTGIAAVSIWMGSLLTQRVRDIVAGNPAKLGHILDTAETPELTATSSQALRRSRTCGPERTDAHRRGAGGQVRDQG